tara:strand:+ start:4074 stop:4259 length:186 start_codon:yes stop_codon:yes gene_type:complete
MLKDIKKPKPKGKTFTIKLSIKQKDKNEALKAIGTKECLKCVKKEKKINMENIFIKNKNKK